MWSNILNFFLLSTIFITPLIPAYFGFGYELSKVLVSLILIIPAGFVFVYLLSKREVKLHWSGIKIAALVFLFILSITSVLGIHPVESLVGKHPYFQGLILYWFLFLFYLMVSEIALDGKSLNKVVTFSAAVVSIIAVAQFILLNFFGLPVPAYAGRVISTFGQPNLYSGFLLLALPFAHQLKEKRIFWISIICLGIFLSISKAAVILLLGLALYIFFRNLRSKSWIIFFILVFLLNALTFSLDKSTGLVWDEIIRPLTKQGTEGYLVEKRIYIIPVILDIYSRSPILGYGIDSINDLYKEHFADFKPELNNYPPLYFNLMNLTIDRSHSYFLDLIIFSGAIGLSAYLYLLYLVFKSKAPGFLKTFIILYLVWTQFQVQSIVHLILFWAVIGIIDNSKKFKHYKS